MKRKTKIIVIVVVLLYFGMHYIYYGSLFNNCVYTEKIIPVSERLLKGKIITTKNAYVVFGDDNKDQSCLKDFSSIDKKIVEPNFSNVTIGVEYENKKELKKDTVFHIVKVISIAKHGITTIDSGNSPIDYLILKDGNGDLYKLATVFLGINNEDLFLSYVSPGDSINGKLLTPFSFKNKNNLFDLVDDKMVNMGN